MANLIVIPSHTIDNYLALLNTVLKRNATRISRSGVEENFQIFYQTRVFDSLRPLAAGPYCKSDPNKVVGPPA